MSKFVCIDEGDQLLEIEMKDDMLVFSVTHESDFSADGGHTFETETAEIGIVGACIPNLVEWLEAQLKHCNYKQMQ